MPATQPVWTEIFPGCWQVTAGPEAKMIPLPRPTPPARRSCRRPAWLPGRLVRRLTAPRCAMDARRLPY